MSHNSDNNENGDRDDIDDLDSASGFSRGDSFNDTQVSQGGNPRQRSRKGCFTCRRRKKRCDEAKPVCNACTRLKLECSYPVAGQERKNRKRKRTDDEAETESPSGTSNTNTSNNTSSAGTPSKIFTSHTSTNPAEKDNDEESLKNAKRGKKSASSKQPDFHLEASTSQPLKKPDGVLRQNGGKPYNLPSPGQFGIYPSNMSEIDHEFLSILESRTPGSQTPAPDNNVHDVNHSLVGSSSSVGHLPELLNHIFPHPTSGLGTTDMGIDSFSTNNTPGIPGSKSNSTHDSNAASFPSPFTAALAALSGPQGPMFSLSGGSSSATGPSNPSNSTSSGAGAGSGQNPDSPMFRSQSPIPPPSSFYLLPNHKTLSNILTASPLIPTCRSPRIEELVNGDEPDGDPGKNKVSKDTDKNSDNQDFSISNTQNSHTSNINGYGDDEDNLSPLTRSNSQVGLISRASSGSNFNISFNNGSNLRSGNNPYTATPESLLFTTPKPWYTLHLDRFGIEMFAYYNNYLANMICISSKMNSFINVFVPMAERDPSVLYALVAYASFHHTMGRYEDVGLRYLNKAIKMVRQDLPKHNLTTLASILIIATAEICKGDMVHWNRHLNAAADVIQVRGGMEAFVNDPTKRWLATNFVYHDLLAASKYEHKPHFEPKEYEHILKNDEGVHTLLGCCKPIFGLLAEIADLAVEAQDVYKAFNAKEESEINGFSFNNGFSPTSTSSPSESGRRSSFSEFAEHVPGQGKHNTTDTQSGPTSSYSEYLKSSNSSFSHRRLSDRVRDLYHRVELLEAKIDSCKPDPNDILSLSKSKGDLEEQLTLFETFQLTAKIHLHQSICRRNAACLHLQVLTSELITSLDVVLNTKVEGSLIFPLFIASIMSTTTKQRTEMVARFDMLYKRQLARNIVRALNLAEEVWKIDDNGAKHVNWYKVLEKNGWDICFS